MQNKGLIKFLILFLNFYFCSEELLFFNYYLLHFLETDNLKNSNLNIKLTQSLIDSALDLLDGLKFG